MTEPYLEQQLRDHGAAQVRFAALIDLPDERKTAFDLHYRALTTHRQGVLVGYGLKHAGTLRQSALCRPAGPMRPDEG